MSHAKKLTFVLAALTVSGLVLLGCRKDREDTAVDSTPVVLKPQGSRTRSKRRSNADIRTVSLTASFVGREVCKECHAENHGLHAKSGHASTFAMAHESPVVGKLAGKTFDAGEPYGSYKYTQQQNTLLARLPDRFGDDPFPLQFALGSGHNAITLLTLLPDENDGTIGIEHRVSWYGTDDQLDITPGQVGKVPTSGPEFFGTTFRGEKLEACIGCHVTSGKIVGQKVVDLIPSVNCERCHGPGSEHVRQARLSATPPPFAVGRVDWTTESEVQLCGSCHRMPANVSRKELRDYPKKVVKFQPVGMLRSRCYLESDGQMKCTTCHNPHMAINAKAELAYEQDCVSCHLEESSEHVSCPVSPQENCVQCHMPKFTFERGITFHDHWIRVIKN